MHIAACQMTLRLAENHTLKGKRQVIRSISARVRNRFNVSIAEVGDNDVWQRANIAFCCVSNDSRHANQQLSEVIDYIQEHVRGDAEVLDYDTELVSGLF